MGGGKGRGQEGMHMHGNRYIYRKSDISVMRLQFRVTLGLLFVCISPPYLSASSYAFVGHQVLGVSLIRKQLAQSHPSNEKESSIYTQMVRHGYSNDGILYNNPIKIPSYLNKILSTDLSPFISQQEGGQCDTCFCSGC